MINNRIDNLLVFDFETGGLKCRKNQAIEFAGIWVDATDLREITRYEALILPFGDFTIDQQALDANGIKIEEIAESGVEVSTVVKEIIKCTELSNKGKMRGKKTLLVGQNVQFDIGFLQQIFKETKQDLSKYFTGSEDFYGNFQPAFFDTQYMGRAKYALDENKTAFNLKSLCEYEAVDLIDAHRAMADTESTLELFKKYVSALRDGQSGQLFNPRKDFKFQI